MKTAGSLVDQLEELVNDVSSLSDRLAQTSEDLRLAQSLHAQGVVAELAESRKTLLDLAARLAEMEKFLSPSGELVPEPLEKPPPAVSPKGAVSLRPARKEESLSSTDSPLGRKWEEAEARLTGLTQLIERSLRAESASDAAMNLGNLALQYHRQKKFEEAERLYQHALAFREKFFGPDHSSVATGLNNLAILCRDQGRYEEATELFRRSLAITESAWGPEHPKVARRLCNLASLALKQEKFSEAKHLFGRILAISEKHERVALPEVTASLRKYAEALQKTGRAEESAEVITRLQTIQAGRPSRAGTGGDAASGVGTF